ncbi:hypothetical protein [Algiphilus sp.]|uniref:hypothetical protein n=1 Tax=Algiphilus sp. TaxID=1872431 RepID=UPI003B518101
MCVLTLVASGLLGACGGGGGGGGGGGSAAPAAVDRLAVKFGLAQAKGLVITGTVSADATKQSDDAECTDDNGDPGELVMIDGQEFCQADLRSETLYAVDENGLLVRVLYFDEDGNELASESFRPGAVVRIEDDYVAAIITPPTGREQLFVRQSDGAVFEANQWAGTIPSGPVGLDSPNGGAAYALGARGSLFNEVSDELFLVLRAEEDFFDTGLFRAQRSNPGRDLVAERISPATQPVPVYFLLPSTASTVVNHAIYTENSGSSELFLRYVDNDASGELTLDRQSDLNLLNFATRGFTVNPKINGFDLPTRTNRTYDRFSGAPFRFRSGEVVLGGVANYATDNSDIADNDIVMYELAVDGSNDELVLSNPTVVSSPDECRYSGEDGAQGPEASFINSAAGPFGLSLSELSERTLISLDGNGRCIVEVRLDAPLDERIAITVVDNLVQAGFVVGAQRSPAEPAPALFTDRTIFALGREDGDSQDVVYAYDRDAGYAATRLNFDGFTIQKLRPFANDQIVVEATDTSNGDAVVLVAGAGVEPPREISRDGSVEFVTLERLD